MSGPETSAPRAAASARRGTLRDLLPRLFREKKLGAVGMIIVLVFLLVGVFADVLAPYDMRERNLKHALEGPSAQFPLGTDHIGRDLLSRVIRGARISMVVGVGAVAIGLVIALFFGLLSGYWGGVFDLLVQRLVDAWLTFPVAVHRPDRDVATAPLLALWPGLSLHGGGAAAGPVARPVLAIVVFGINMFGDALRDLLNPRLTGGAGRLGAAKVQKAAKPTA